MEVDPVSRKRGASIALPEDLESEERVALSESGDAGQLIFAYDHTQQPLSYLESQLAYGDDHVAQYTTGIFSWSSPYHHGGSLDGKLWASGLQWPEGYQKEAAVADIKAALEAAGVTGDAYEANSIYVSTPYGAASRKLAGGSFSISFVNLETADKLVHGKVTVRLPVISAAHGKGAQGSPLWTKDPGAVQLAKEDYAAAKILVSHEAIKDLDAPQLSILFLETAAELYSQSQQQRGSQQLQKQLRAIADSLQHYPGHVRKRQQSSQGVVMVGSPVAARLLLERGVLRTKLGELQIAPPLPPLKIRGLQVVLGPHYVGNLLAAIRGISPYKLGGARVPTVEELDQIRQLVGEVLRAGEREEVGEMPEDPPPQAIRGKATDKGQSASVLLAVPSQAAADELIRGVTTTDGLYMKWQSRRMKAR